MNASANNKLVSVIIPVYNVEKYIDECISSVIAQTYENIEVILIDDGATDSSGKICDTWADKDSRISVIHQENGGLSAARNAGLDKAKGDFICFVDSDDSIERTHIEDFVSAILANDADLALCDVDSAKLCEPEINVKEPTVFSAKELREFLCNPNSREYVEIVIACNKLYKRDFFATNRFETGKLHEDEFMINHLIYNIDKAVYIPSRNYIYRVNDEGITGSSNESDIRHLQVADAYVERAKIALDNNDRGFASETLKWILLKLIKYANSSDADMRLAAKAKYTEIFDEYRYLLTKKQVMKYWLFKIFPSAYNILFR